MAEHAVVAFDVTALEHAELLEGSQEPRDQDLVVNYS